MKLEYSLSSYTKTNSKWLKELNIRHDTIKLLEENICKTFSDINRTNVFFKWVSKSYWNKSKNKQMEPKLISFCTAKEAINKMERQLTDWETNTKL